MWLIIIVIGLITGTLIGIVGIGGILLSPLLNAFMGLNLHVAMASSSLSFLFTGIVGTLSYAKRKSISWSHVGWLSLGIVPATIMGARVNAALSSNVLTIVLAVLIAFSGFYALYKRPSTTLELPQLNKWKLMMIGIGVGFGSALTGTGGPVILVPILVALNFPALAAVGISQAIQLPIATFATVGFTLYGRIDFWLGLSLGIIQAVGVFIGAKIAHKLPAPKLRQLVAIALIGVAILLIGRALF